MRCLLIGFGRAAISVETRDMFGGTGRRYEREREKESESEGARERGSEKELGREHICRDCAGREGQNR